MNVGIFCDFTDNKIGIIRPCKKSYCSICVAVTVMSNLTWWLEKFLKLFVAAMIGADVAVIAIIKCPAALPACALFGLLSSVNQTKERYEDNDDNAGVSDHQDRGTLLTMQTSRAGVFV